MGCTLGTQEGVVHIVCRTRQAHLYLVALWEELWKSRERLERLKCWTKKFGLHPVRSGNCRSIFEKKDK